MSRLVECVPNFSEGRNKEVIEAISLSVSQTPGVSLLDVDPGVSTNRTVFTFVGSPEAVVTAALNAAKTAHERIDMTTHRGEHPRLGALDVCPFVPVQNVSMDDCVKCAEEFGQKLAQTLQVPVYLYGAAARSESRRSLPSVRAGEYEGLPQKLQCSDWAPDFGPAHFVPSWGATVTGARKFLIAFNVNLLSTKEQAHRIALDIREQGRGKDRPGLLQKVQGMGWFLEESNLAQVSTNILDFEETPVHQVYEQVCSKARELKLPVVGSEVVGLLPLQAVLDTAEFYIKRDELFVIEEEHKVRLVVSKLGLDSLGPFNPKERIIEYMVSSHDAAGLSSLPLRDFVLRVGARSAAPGGGSVSAAIAAMGAALAHTCVSCSTRLSPVDALKMPKNTDEERTRREQQVQAGLQEAVKVPLSLAQKISGLWTHLKELCLHGNATCQSDAQVAVKALETAVFGAYFNVIINLKEIKDQEFKQKMEREARALLQEAQDNATACLCACEQRTSQH
ncbi:formimidoyltransferase-cyclodeaminase [Boleophthalmus pectinirostris]|uniref:formimidoyltransferase-cyclodeaminase n=1 Tax=Boleophthalmus pectinirostris TaxID=150288 RepID=UPI00242FAAF9|nr:formimidoyltransferase-cyclodeaminase [Boleophthalmus pectinirostris]